jgi:ferrous iron transport protein B
MICHWLCGFALPAKNLVGLHEFKLGSVDAAEPTQDFVTRKINETHTPLL